MTRGHLRKIVLATFAVGLSLAFLFNNCSEVKFDQVSKGSTLPLCEDIENCESGNWKKVEEKRTVSNVSRAVDILLVIDNSGSMRDEIEEMGKRLDGFVGVLDDKNIDWRMCYTLTDGSGETGYWKGLDEKVLQGDRDNRAAVFNNTMNDLAGGGDGNERAITSANAAVLRSNNEKCFRDDAALSVVILSDEDQKSCGGRCKDHDGTDNHGAQDYEDQYRPLTEKDRPAYFIETVADIWPQKPLTVHSIVIRANDKACYEIQDKQDPAFYGLFYSKLSEKTAGIIGDVCAASYADQLKDISARVEDSLSSMTLKCQPVGPDPAVNIRKTSKDIEIRGQGDKLFFTPSLPPGTTVELQYYCKKQA